MEGGFKLKNRTNLLKSKRINLAPKYWLRLRLPILVGLLYKKLIPKNIPVILKMKKNNGYNSK
jgi:hypothetical protein